MSVATDKPAKVAEMTVALDLPLTRLLLCHAAVRDNPLTDAVLLSDSDGEVIAWATDRYTALRAETGIAAPDGFATLAVPAGPLEDLADVADVGALIEIEVDEKGLWITVEGPGGRYRVTNSTAWAGAPETVSDHVRKVAALFAKTSEATSGRGSSDSYFNPTYLARFAITNDDGNYLPTAVVGVGLDPHLVKIHQRPDLTGLIMPVKT